MATFYLDPVNGLDANAGTSWATAWKTVTTGATAARHAAGDTIRIAKTPDPVDTGNTATWVSGAYGPTSSGISSSTNATPIVITMTLPHGMITGDWVGVNGHLTNTNANGTWPITVLSSNTFSIPTTGNGAGSGGTVYKVSNQIVVLSSPVTAVISNCDVIWSAGTSCVPTLETTANSKEGSSSAKLTITTPATAIKLAYSTIASTNYSSYNQISFWIKNSVVVTAGQYTVNICSDTIGATVVVSVAVPAIPTTGQWVALTFDTGSALGSAIQSVALYTGATTGTSNVINLDHIIACGPSGNADSISLTSLIGKNNGTEGWFNIRSISNAGVMYLDHGTLSWVNSRGYYGTSETVELWRRETFKQTMQIGVSGGMGSNNTVQKNGSAGNLITYSGGWNITSNTQDGQTFWDGQNGGGTGFHAGIDFGVRSYIGLDHMNFSRFFSAVAGYDNGTWWDNCNFNLFNVTSCAGVCHARLTNTTLTVSNMSLLTTQGIIGESSNGLGNNSNLTITNGFGVSGTAVTVNISSTLTVGSIASSTTGILFNSANNNNATVGNIAGCSTGFSFNNSNSSNVAVGAITGCSTGLNLTGSISNVIRGTVFSGNTTDFSSSSNVGANYILDPTYSVAPTLSGSVDERLFIRNPNGTTSAMCYSDNMTAQTDLSTVHAGNRSWKIATSRTVSTYPATLNLGYVVIAGNVTNTISAWVRYDTAGMIAGIQVVGNQIEGMTATQLVTSTGTANTWIQVTLTITTATQSGPVMLQAYGLSSSGTQNMWIADVSVS